MVEILISEYDLNPITVWEVILRQSFDKVFSIDNKTAFYNIEVLQDGHVYKKSLIKILHLIERNLLFTFVTDDGK